MFYTARTARCVLDGPHLRPVVAGANLAGSGGQVSVRENSSVNMTCQVDALPAVSASALSWYRNGSLLHAGQYYVMSVVRRRDAGHYECVTSNTMRPTYGSSQIGVGRATVNLFVTCKHFSLHLHACVLTM